MRIETNLKMILFVGLSKFGFSKLTIMLMIPYKDKLSIATEMDKFIKR
jgi:hypothetical protein